MQRSAYFPEGTFSSEDQKASRYWNVANCNEFIQRLWSKWKWCADPTGTNATSSSPAKRRRPMGSQSWAPWSSVSASWGLSHSH